MAGLRKKRRIQLIIAAFVFLGLSTALIGYAVRDGINLFRSPSQVMADTPEPTEVFRLGGLVEHESIRRGQGTRTHFRVTDGGATIDAFYDGILPDLFKEGQGMIGTGRLIDGVFVASELLARHDEAYMPREVADALKAQGLYKPDAAPIASSSSGDGY
ncbi:MAG: cytochrome c maturation protein CcmE [Rhodobacteraceae bacterium]|nr:cytochrome c maturation protein CcmE [Paracoccaceae bacterium]